MDLVSWSNLLQPYKEIVGTVASVVTIGQFLSGIFICRDIYRKSSTEGVSSNPFVGGIVIGVLMLKYAIMLNDNAMFNVNLAAIVLNMLYLFFYSAYSRAKYEVVKTVGVGLAIMSLFLFYAKIESNENVEYRYGLIVTILMLMLLGSPLVEVRNVISSQDASCIPFPIVLSGSVVSFLWFIYGIIIMNNFMIVQNAIGLILCLIQVYLCYKYSTKEKTN